MLTKNYCLASTCISVHGYTRTALYDLPKDSYQFVPNSMSSFLQLLNKKTILEIYNGTLNKDKDIIKEYLEYCLKYEYVLEIPHEVDKKNFPKLSLIYESPNIISNVCLNINNYSVNNFEKIRDILIAIKCYTIQIVFDKNFDLKNISTCLDILKDIGMSSMELIIRYNNNFEYKTLVDKYKNISFIFIYSAPLSQFLKSHVFGLQQIFTSKNEFEITNKKSIEFFNVNITLFTESQKHNTYFNRKLFIGENGEIKNSSLEITVHGNINELKHADDILQIVNSTKFQKYWFVHKELIDVCKQCEFRHMCVDNRIPIERNEKEWYMETECNYNPYIAKWKDEKGYKTLTECGISSNQDGFKINRKKVNAINKELWGD